MDTYNCHTENSAPARRDASRGDAAPSTPCIVFVSSSAFFLMIRFEMELKGNNDRTLFLSILAKSTIPTSKPGSVFLVTKRGVRRSASGFRLHALSDPPSKAAVWKPRLQFRPREQLHSPKAILMAAATLASSVVVRGTPVASVAAGKRANARPMRGSALVVRAEGEIAGLSECGKFQELCKAEIPGKIPRCVTTDAPRGVPDRDVSRRLRASPRRRATRARRPANIRTFSDVSSRRSRSKDEAPSRGR